MAHVDWMLLATMRRNENVVVSIDEDPGGLQGMTTPWEMKGWIYEILGFDDANFDETYFFGEMGALNTARDAWNSGGVVFFMIHEDMLEDGSDDSWAPWPTHMIAFDDNLSIKQDDDASWYEWDTRRVRFRCFSRGALEDVDISEGRFESNMYGIIYAKGTIVT